MIRCYEATTEAARVLFNEGSLHRSGEVATSYLHKHINITNMDYYNPNKAAWNKKLHRKPNLFNPTFASQLVTEVLTQDMFSEAAQQSPREIRPDGQEALERARHQFEARQMPVAHPPAPSTNNKQPAGTPRASRDSAIRHDLLRNPLVFEYELKRAAYRNSLEHQRNNSMESRPAVNFYNFNNDTAIYKKQAKDFNIISLLPEANHELREFHKLSTENKFGWHLDGPQPAGGQHNHSNNPEHLH